MLSGSLACMRSSFTPSLEGKSGAKVPFTDGWRKKLVPWSLQKENLTDTLSPLSSEFSGVGAAAWLSANSESVQPLAFVGLCFPSSSSPHHVCLFT